LKCGILRGNGGEMKKKDLSGMIFGRLEAVQWHSKSKNGTSKWLCKCVCGNEKIVFATALLSGQTQSCGCLAGELASVRLIKHGHTSVCNQKVGNDRRSPTYITWDRMLARCNDPSNKYYHGCGITVCEAWLDFSNFLKDMGERPDGKTIDRIDNTKGYSLDNCRWATPIQQGNNRKNNVILTHNGISKTVTEWCKDLELSYTAIIKRANAGWADDKILSTPVRKKNTIINGESKND
jgi:hypothetical protein